jgi:hypothetical protein
MRPGISGNRKGQRMLRIAIGPFRHDQIIAHQQSRHHRFRRNAERGDDEAAQNEHKQRQLARGMRKNCPPSAFAASHRARDRAGKGSVFGHAARCGAAEPMRQASNRTSAWQASMNVGPNQVCPARNAACVVRGRCRRLPAFRGTWPGSISIFRKTHLTPAIWWRTLPRWPRPPDFDAHRARCLAGAIVNVTEGRAAEHTAQRGEGEAEAVALAKALSCSGCAG